jgi:hypothetical protein
MCCYTDIHEAQVIRFSLAELKTLRANTTNRLRLSNGDFVGVLEPYHQLHCLNIFRKTIHWEYYSSKVSVEERAFKKFGKPHLGIFQCYIDYGKILTF